MRVEMPAAWTWLGAAVVCAYTSRNPVKETGSQAWRRGRTSPGAGSCGSSWAVNHARTPGQTGERHILHSGTEEKENKDVKKRTGQTRASDSEFGLYLALVLVFLGWSSHDVDLCGLQAQRAVHRHVLHRAIRCADFNVALQHANKMRVG